MSKERKAVLSYVVDTVAKSVTFGVVGAGSTTLHLSKMTEAALQAALYNGVKQAGGDKAAIPHDPKTGLAATPAEKFARVKAWVENLNQGGEWTMRQAALPFNRDALFEAVATARKVGLDAVLAKWGNMDDAFLRLRLADKEVAAEYARLVATGTEDAGLFQGLED